MRGKSALNFDVYLIRRFAIGDRADTHTLRRTGTIVIKQRERRFSQKSKKAETNKENVPAGRRAAAKGAEGTGTRPGKKADMQCCAQIKPAFAGQAQQTK